MIVIIDAGIGNVRSVQNMLARGGHEAIISSSHQEILAATKLILPGVGAFDAAIDKIKRSDLLGALHEAVKEKKTKILGICVGMQILAQESEEGDAQGLGWINAQVLRLPKTDAFQQKLTVPHMGWNELELHKGNCIFSQFTEASRFYFVHSYFMQCNNPDNVIATTNHGIKFVAAIRHENIWGVQFHPEKSHQFGMKLLTNFAKLDDA